MTSELPSTYERLRTKRGNISQKADIGILERQKLWLHQQPDIARQLTLKYQGCIKTRSLLIAVKSLCHFIIQEAPDTTSAEMF